MNILIAGGSGLIGSNLTNSLRKKGHVIYFLSRKKESIDSNTFYWNPEGNQIDENCLKNCDIVINLAGENIGKGGWSESRKKQLLDSRTYSTRLLVKTINNTNSNIKHFLNASAIGFYPATDNLMTEEDKEGSSFLSQICSLWEKEVLKLTNLQTTATILRFGTVLTKKGGALKEMLPIFKLGLGGHLGSGDQFFSWISLEDCLRAIEFIIEKKISGPVNITAPNYPTNKELTNALNKSLNRPGFLPVPSTILKLVLGKEKAEELLLFSHRVEPTNLLKQGFKFKHTNITDFLKGELS